ncbi:MAG: amidohydrolase [Spirosomataceae bacterium]
MKKRLFVLPLVCLLALGYMTFTDYSHQNDTLYFGGDIITMHDSTDRAEAIHVRDGKIIALGRKNDLLKNIPNQTQLVDLQGKTLLPGFFDAHGHFDLATVFGGMVDISGIKYRNPKEVWQIMEEESRKGEAGKWLFFYGFDPILTKGISSPTIHYLDSIAPDKPVVVITKALHVFYANRLAFKELGLSDKTPDPSKMSYYERDAQGKLTGGIIEQGAIEPFRKKIQEIAKQEFVGNTQKVLDEYASYGVTSAVNMGLTNANKNILSLYEHLAAEKSKPLYKFLALMGKLPKRRPSQRLFLYLRKENDELLPESPDNGDDFYKIMGIKFWYDGSPYAGSMYVKQPYIRSKFTENDLHLTPNHTSHSILKPDELEKYIKKYQSKGWKVAVHAQGDMAGDEVMEVFEKLHQQSPISSHRHRIEHCMLLPAARAKSMKAMNVSPSFHINHLLYYGEFLGSDILGAQRANLIFPIRSVAEAGIPYSVHADMPQFIPNPLSLAGTSVHRTTQDGLVLNAAEKVSGWQALKSITIEAAWQLNLETKLGSLEKGKYADLVILDANPLKTAPEQWTSIKVMETVVAGNTIWKR